MPPLLVNESNRSLSEIGIAFDMHNHAQGTNLGMYLCCFRDRECLGATASAHKQSPRVEDKDIAKSINCRQHGYIAYHIGRKRTHFGTKED